MRMHLMKKKNKIDQAVDKFCQTKGMKKVISRKFENQINQE